MLADKMREFSSLRDAFGEQTVRIDSVCENIRSTARRIEAIGKVA